MDNTKNLLSFYPVQIPLILWPFQFSAVISIHRKQYLLSCPALECICTAELEVGTLKKEELLNGAKNKIRSLWVFKWDELKYSHLNKPLKKGKVFVVSLRNTENCNR